MSVTPWYPVRGESAVHIAAANLLVRGLSQAHIARTFGKSAAWMSNLVRQKFFQARCVEVVSEINTDLVSQQVHWKRRRVRPIIVVGLHDAGGSNDVPAVSFATDVRGERICEGPAVKEKKPRPRRTVQNGHQAASKPVPEENYFAETPPKLVNPRERATAEIDRYENYRRYCP